MKQMFFRFSSEVVGLRPSLEGFNDVEINFNSPIQGTLRFTSKYPDGKDTSEPSSIICTAATVGNVADDQAAADIHNAVAVSKDGIRPWFEGLDQSRMSAIYVAVDSFFEPLRTQIKSTVAFLRWRYGLPEGPTNPFQKAKEFLSEDGAAWYEMHVARSMTLTIGRPFSKIILTPELRHQLTEFIGVAGDEPLGHQLLREAYNQLDLHPRSALVIGVAAAEVGLKKLIAQLAPQTQWLLDEIQMPPFTKMLRKYLISLPVKYRFKDKTITPPNRIVNKLEVAVELRNKIVHVGKEPPDRQELKEILRAVEDFLWMCDLYSGYTWAAEHISYETRLAWKDEKQLPST